jgi:hypothetical protein
MAAETTTVRSEPAMPATGCMASAAVLRRERHSGQQQHERRDEKRSMHNPIICPIEAGEAGNWYLGEGELGQLSAAETNGKPLSLLALCL